MSFGCYRFGCFVLDPANRQLTRNDVPVSLNSRYLDALILLVREHGQLVSKERFLEEVWKGAPVTDEAVTQCIRTLRNRLGDRASMPRYIETVPKYGYRFIETVARQTMSAASDEETSSQSKWRDVVTLGAVGTLGGGIAGVVGGLLYGFAAASQSSPGESGAISVVLVVLALTLLVAVIGGTGVGFGVAAARIFFRQSLVLSIAGGATGGMVVGAVVKLLGIDAFILLFGQSPGDVTGAAEGLILGGAVGLSIGMANRESLSTSVTRRIAGAALIGSGAGILITLLGGRLMIGSLDLIVMQFSGSHLRLDPIGQLLGEPGLEGVGRLATSGLEGALFAASLAGALVIAQPGRNGVGSIGQTA